MITISTTSFTANAVVQAQITIPADIVSAGIGTELSGIRFSKDGTTFSDELLYNEGGTYTIYVKCGNISGTFANGVGWYTWDGTAMDEGAWNVTVTGATPKQFESLNMSLSPRASTIQYSGEQVNGSMSVGDTISGTILDHHYNFEIERYTRQGNRRSFSGAFSATKLVESLIVYQVCYEWHWSHLTWERPSFTDHLSAISSAINIPIVYSGANFFPKTDMNFLLRKNSFDLDFYEKISGSFSEILNRLIGWSTDVPSMTINLYVENGTIYLIQRGNETTTRTPDGIVMHPTLTYSKRHTEWANSATQTVVPKEIASSDTANSNTPFTGTIQFGTASLTYTDGLLTQETNGDTVTTYTYTSIDDDKYLSQKVSVTTDPDTGDTTTATTTYSYETTQVDLYLREEHLTVVDANGDTTTDRITTHSFLGNGFYGTTTRDLLDEDAVVSDGLSTGAPGQKASQYMIDNSNDSIRNANAQNPRQMVVALNGVPKARATYPVADYNTLSAIASCLDQYEGKTEVQIQLELVGGSHLFTYADKLSYNGYVYYIVSNNVTVTGDKLRQNITGVRWVL